MGIIRALNEHPPKRAAALFERVVGRLPLCKSEPLFAADECDRLRASLGLAGVDEARALATQCGELVLKATYEGRPESVESELVAAGLDADHVRHVLDVWHRLGPAMAERMRERSGGAVQLAGVSFACGVATASSDKQQLNEPVAHVRLALRRDAGARLVDEPHAVHMDSEQLDTCLRHFDDIAAKLDLFMK